MKLLLYSIVDKYTNKRFSNELLNWNTHKEIFNEEGAFFRTDRAVKKHIKRLVSHGSLQIKKYGFKDEIGWPVWVQGEIDPLLIDRYEVEIIHAVSSKPSQRISAEEFLK